MLFGDLKSARKESYMYDQKLYAALKMKTKHKATINDAGITAYSTRLHSTLRLLPPLQKRDSTIDNVLVTYRCRRFLQTAKKSEVKTNYQYSRHEGGARLLNCKRERRSRGMKECGTVPLNFCCQQHDARQHCLGRSGNKYS